MQKTKLTIDAYNKNAEKYTLKFNNLPAYKDKITEFQKKYIPKGARILDLGCGPGNNIKTILEIDSSCNFTGIDLSTEFIKIAKQQNPACDFLNQDIRKINLDSQYDIVIASFCIVHLTNDETQNFLKDISSILCENGHLYLSFMEGDNSGLESTSFSKEKIFFNYYQRADVLESLKKYEIRPVEIKSEEYLEKDGSKTTDIFIFANKITI